MLSILKPVAKDRYGRSAKPSVATAKGRDKELRFGGS